MKIRSYFCFHSRGCTNGFLRSGWITSIKIIRIPGNPNHLWGFINWCFRGQIWGGLDIFRVRSSGICGTVYKLCLSTTVPDRLVNWTTCVWRPGGIKDLTPSTSLVMYPLVCGWGTLKSTIWRSGQDNDNMCCLGHLRWPFQWITWLFVPSVSGRVQWWLLKQYVFYGRIPSM